MRKRITSIFERNKWENGIDLRFRSTKQSYLTVMKRFENYCEGLNQQQKIDYCEITLKMLKKSLVSDLMMTHLFRPIRLKGRIFDLFPDCCYVDDEYISFATGQNCVIDFDEDDVVVIPAEPLKLAKTWRRSKKEAFIFDKINHYSKTYSEINFSVISNGRHSSTQGIVDRLGTIESELIDFNLVLKYFDTDGQYWINKVDKSKVTLVLDFRAALIFKIFKYVQSLKQHD